jgi:ketosteroid isomerase-like protein
MNPTTEQNKTVIRRFLEAWNNRQPHLFDELIASDVVRHCQATPAVDVRTLDQLKEFLQRDTAIFTDSKQTIVRMVARVTSWGYGDLRRHAARANRSAARLKRQDAVRLRRGVPWPAARSLNGGTPGTI